jgi:hypothetical protein
MSALTTTTTYAGCAILASSPTTKNMHPSKAASSMPTRTHSLMVTTTCPQCAVLVRVSPGHGVRGGTGAGMGGIINNGDEGVVEGDRERMRG